MKRNLWMLVCAGSLVIGTACEDKNDEGNDGNGDTEGGGGEGDDGTGDGGDAGDDGTSGGSASGSGGSADGGTGGTAGDSGGSGADTSGTGDGTGPGDCMGSHPETGDGSRWCAEGSCYCASQDMGLDVCYDEAEAEGCCPVDLTSCGPPGGGGDCRPAHPEFDPNSPDNRWCLDGSCYCRDEANQTESCLPEDQADRCCEGSITRCWP